MYQIENMTDPDHCCSQVRQPLASGHCATLFWSQRMAGPRGIPPMIPKIGPDLAVQIQEVHIPRLKRSEGLGLIPSF